MIYRSTRSSTVAAGFAEVIIRGLAPDGGLYVPTSLPSIDTHLLHEMSNEPLSSLASFILEPFVGDDLSKSALDQICKDTLTFDMPIVRVSDTRSVLELFHGPTQAFKDVGARFMSRVLSEIISEPLTILVATSGDTGSAVAHGFHRIPGIEVKVLFPEGRVSPYQESQMCTLGDNVEAIAVRGSFDDCQDLVKQAFNDVEVRSRLQLSSANSINIGRLLPQMIYYYRLMQHLSPNDLRQTYVCVPSGNFGNLTSGLYAHWRGVDARGFIAATNANKTFPEYLNTGVYEPRPSVRTPSNAMDVGKPSNFERMMHLFDHDVHRVKSMVQSISVSDEKTLSTIQQVYADHQYVLDPHVAVGWSACESLLSDSTHAIILGTAHPMKFHHMVDQAAPGALVAPHVDVRRHTKTLMKNSFDVFKSLLLDSRP